MAKLVCFFVDVFLLLSLGFILTENGLKLIEVLLNENFFDLGHTIGEALLLIKINRFVFFILLLVDYEQLILLGDFDTLLF